MTYTELASEAAWCYRLKAVLGSDPTGFPTRPNPNALRAIVPELPKSMFVAA
jgi:hypothetical protein